MRGFYIEPRKLSEGASLSRDLAQHILIRAVKGCVVVVAERPQELASITKKQWHVLIRLVQRERSSTLRAARIAELSNQIRWMERLAFSSKFTGELPENGVIFATATALLAHPPICSTLYITQSITDEQFHLITSWMRKESVVVVYRMVG